MAIGLTNWFKKTFLDYEEKTVRNRTKKGRYVADDPTTKNINESYKTVIKPTATPTQKK